MNMKENLDKTLLKCLVCNETDNDYNYNIFETKSKHSDTYLYIFIERFTDHNLKSLKINNSNICDVCVSHLNEFDSAQITCTKIEKIILEKFNITLIKNKDFSLNSFDLDSTEFTSNDLEYEVNVKVEESNHKQIDKKIKQRRLPKISKLLRNQRVIRKKTSSECVPIIASTVYVCENCGKECKTKGEFKAHQITHSKVRNYICELCGQSYRQPGALKIHIQLHSGHSPFECATCGKQFTQKGALVRHANIHTGVPKYQCDQCGKQFIHRTSFQMHILMHENVRKYTCDSCGLAFRSSSHLNRHKRTHSGERRYTCTECGKSFVERYNLVAHMRTHGDQSEQTGLKKHKCPVCLISFERLKKLKDHLKSAHITVKTELALDIADHILKTEN